MKRFDPSLLPPTPDFQFEKKLWGNGLHTIAGIDDAGRGALAGPVAAGVVIFPPDESLVDLLHGLTDSKQMTPAQREGWAASIREAALAWEVGFASHQEIDDLGIVSATRLAALRALHACSEQADHLLLDYLFLPDLDLPQTNLVKGDQRSLSIAAASVLAKTSRDGRMGELDAEFPGYKLTDNKGYGTREHLAALEQSGPSPIHRLTFAPIRNIS